MNVNALGHWVDGLQQKGVYTFSRSDAIHASGLSPEAVKKSLQRLTKRKRVAKVTNSFYVVVPTEYMSAGVPPAPWFIHQLMEAKRKPYYVGLLSAASLHGASHHQPQEFQVLTNAASRSITIGRQHIHFFTKRSLERTPVVEIKTPTGMIHVSTPEATALDLVRFSKAAGHLGNVATVLSDLAEKLRPDAMLVAAQQCGDVPTVQRLGYLLDLVGADAIAGPLAEWLVTHPHRAIPLRPGRQVELESLNSRWNIWVNEQIEVES